MQLEDVQGPGAYALVVAIDRPERLAIPSLGEPVLTPGHYAYCGSAFGPGGMRARLERHLRRDKLRHWHVDHLTGAGRIVAIGIAPGGNECDLLHRIRGDRISALPLLDFGSSDCRRCPSHLAAVPETVDLERLGLRTVEFMAVAR